MGDSRPITPPAFGKVDLDLGDERFSARPPATPSFGHVDFDLGPDFGTGDGSDPHLGNTPPESEARAFVEREESSKVTRRNLAAVAVPPGARPSTAEHPVYSARSAHSARSADGAPSSPPASSSVHEDSTRILPGDALAKLTRPPPPAESLPAAGRAWDEIDANLMALGEASSESSPGSARGGAPAPSGSGVATRDARVAAMRELYAQGDADGALALAASLDQDDYEADEAGITVDFDDAAEPADPFGGLIPIDDELAARPTAAPKPIDAAAPVDVRSPTLPRASMPTPMRTARPAPLLTPAARPAHREMSRPQSRLPRVVPPPMRAPISTKPPSAAPQLSLTERHSIPRVLKSMNEVAKLPIDHRAGFLLAHFDGMQTLEEILDICAMPATDALDLIAKLKEMGVIEFE